MSTKDRLQEVQKLLNMLVDVYDEVSAKQANPIDTFYLKKIEEWANKIHGISSGYKGEFEEMYKHRTMKGRAIYGGFADVSVGEPTDFHAKSIQLKSTNQDDHTAVNNMIRVAANQLTGERGETPRANDRWVIDMIVHNPENTWPLGRNTLGSMTFDEFGQNAGSKLVDLMLDYQKHVNPKQKRDQPRQARVEGHGMSQGHLRTLTDMSQPLLQCQFTNTQHPRSTQYMHPVQTPSGITYERAHHITVKIRNPVGFPIWNAQTGTYNRLTLAVFNIYRDGNTIRHNFVKSMLT